MPLVRPVTAYVRSDEETVLDTVVYVPATAVHVGEIPVHRSIIQPTSAVPPRSAGAVHETVTVPSLATLERPAGVAEGPDGRPVATEPVPVPCVLMALTRAETTTPFVRPVIVYVVAVDPRVGVIAV